MAQRNTTPRRRARGYSAKLRGAKPGIVYLCTLRRQKRLTQTQLALLSGVSQTHISTLELRNVEKVKRDTVLRLAEALHVDPLMLKFGPNPHVQRRARALWRADQDQQRTADTIADAADTGELP